MANYDVGPLPTDEQLEWYARPQTDNDPDAPPQVDSGYYYDNDTCPSCHSTKVVDCADGEVCLACGWGAAQFEDHDGELDSVIGRESSRA